MADLTVAQLLVYLTGAIGCLSTIVGGLAVVFKYPSKWVNRHLDRKLGEMLDEQAETLLAKLGERLERELAPIRRELTANGGSSVRDVVHATKYKVEGIATQVQSVQRSVDQAHERIDDVLQGGTGSR